MTWVFPHWLHYYQYNMLIYMNLGISTEPRPPLKQYSLEDVRNTKSWTLPTDYRLCLKMSTAQRCGSYLLKHLKIKPSAYRLSPNKVMKIISPNWIVPGNLLTRYLHGFMICMFFILFCRILNKLGGSNQFRRPHSLSFWFLSSTLVSRFVNCFILY